MKFASNIHIKNIKNADLTGDQYIFENKTFFCGPIWLEFGVNTLN